MSNTVITATGAREFFSRPDAASATARLAEFIVSQPDAHWLVGGAEGWDFAVMRELALLNAKFTLCIPNESYLGYYLPRWENQNDVAVFKSLASQAHKVVYVSADRYAPSRDPRENGRRVHSNFVRNQYMVDWATQIASYWTGKPTGGTVHALRYAQYKQVPGEHFGIQFT